jgi:hypothetical protein
VVWRVLTDFARYPAWNPFVVSVDGMAAHHARLAVRLQPWEGRLWRSRPQIVRFSEERELCWRSRLVVPGLLERRHCFHLHPDGPGRTRFVQRREFRGVLSRLVRTSVTEATERGLEGMNEALKERAERRQHPRREPDPVTL